MTMTMFETFLAGYGFGSLLVHVVTIGGWIVGRLIGARLLRPFHEPTDADPYDGCCAGRLPHDSR